MYQNITTLVFDIQDIGARCYTYISTMSECLKSAKNNSKKKTKLKKDVKFVILDRVNPIGGLNVQGSVLELNYTSFIGIWKIPMVHGMTGKQIKSKKLEN
jgi:uncharacterized protein YbbC (DUF1343 family)